MSLQDIVAVSITRVSSAVTQQGFSTPCILAYQTRRTSDRVHSYASLAEMTAAGYTPDDAAYKIASALWSQPNPPAAIKIGRRANAFTKSVRLTPRRRTRRPTPWSAKAWRPPTRATAARPSRKSAPTSPRRSTPWPTWMRS